MPRPCEHCGEEYDAQRSTSRFCSGRCRSRAARSRPADPPVLPAGECERAATARLAGRPVSPVSSVALALARRIDSERPATGLAALVRELRATVKELDTVPVSGLDGMRDELAARRGR